jgi:hypothetical protein
VVFRLFDSSYSYDKIPKIIYGHHQLLPFLNGYFGRIDRIIS